MSAPRACMRIKLTVYAIAANYARWRLEMLTQHNDEQLSGTVFKVVTELQSIKLKQSMALKQSSILQFFA